MPEVLAAIDCALDAIAASGKASGVFAVDPVDAERYLTHVASALLPLPLTSTAWQPP